MLRQGVWFSNRFGLNCMGIVFGIWSELGYHFGVKQVGIYHTVNERHFAVSENECQFWHQV